MNTVEITKISAYKLTISLDEADAVTLMGACQNPIWENNSSEFLVKFQEDIFFELQKLGVRPNLCSGKLADKEPEIDQAEIEKVIADLTVEIKQYTLLELVEEVKTYSAALELIKKLRRAAR